MQVIDFGGQHHYHHSTHLFTRESRAAFIILVNPFEEGFEEQLWYWLRLLTLKATTSFTSTAATLTAAPDLVSGLPQVMVVFSRRDKIVSGPGLSSGSQGAKETVAEKEQELGALVSMAERVFAGRVSVRVGLDGLHPDKEQGTREVHNDAVWSGDVCDGQIPGRA